jgi:hypothetical protein
MTTHGPGSETVSLTPRRRVGGKEIKLLSSALWHSDASSILKLVYLSLLHITFFMHLSCFDLIRPSSGSLYVLYTSHCTLYANILYFHLLKFFIFF